VTRSRTSLTRLVGSFVLCAGLLHTSLLAEAQESGKQAPETVSQEEDRQLWSRGREVLHTGNPLDLVGCEEGDNDFRRRTPALESSDREVQRVDRDELYRRRMAMYTEGRAFHTPLPAVSGWPTGSRPPAGIRVEPATSEAKPTGEDENGSAWPVVLPGSLLLLLLVLVRLRR